MWSSGQGASDLFLNIPLRSHRAKNQEAGVFSDRGSREMRQPPSIFRCFFGVTDIKYIRPMGLIAVLQDELKSAMKGGDAERRDTIRFLQSALKNTAIDLRKPVGDLSDEEVRAVIRKLAKQRRESIAQYRSGSREDLAEREEKELHILSEFLPAEMEEEEMRKIVAEALIECGAVSRKDGGRAMGFVMKKIAGRASGDAVRRAVNELLPEEA